MKYLVFQAQFDAENAARKIYADAVRARADELDGMIDDWNNGRAKTSVKNVPDDQIDGDRFPIYGRNAATHAVETESGHTKAWAIPVQISDGRWVFPSPDDEGVEDTPDWWPAADRTLNLAP
jgi:hypothetical protein